MCEWGYNILLKSFQFHKGTIRTDDFTQYLNDKTDFNSIKVRLELPGLCQAVEVSGFQFHKGTIRTRERATEGRTDRPFQFHKGTIRTVSLPYWQSFETISIP